MSIEMLELVHTRLQNTLLAIADASTEENFPQEKLTAAMSDAWSMVDSFHRLADLAQHIPNVVRRKQIPFFHNLIAANSQVNHLRNTVQHLPEKIQGAATSPDWSVWGVLNWAVPPPSEYGEIRCCAYFCGKLTAGERPFPNPLGKPIRRPVGLITLSQDPQSVCLSDLYGCVERFAEGLQQMTERVFRSEPRLTETYGSDVLISLLMGEVDSPSPLMEGQQ